MLFTGGEMERRGCWGRKEIYAVVVLKGRWSWWCGSYGEGGAV